MFCDDVEGDKSRRRIRCEQPLRDCLYEANHDLSPDSRDSSRSWADDSNRNADRSERADGSSLLWVEAAHPRRLVQAELQTVDPNNSAPAQQSSEGKAFDDLQPR